MAYYNPYGQPTYPYTAAPYPAQTQTTTTVPHPQLVWVNGTEEAERFVVPPGQSAFIMDRESDTFYIKTVDNLGMAKPLRIFDYKERLPEPVEAPRVAQAQTQIPQIDMSPYLTRAEFEDKITELRNMIKPNKKNNKAVNNNG